MHALWWCAWMLMASEPADDGAVMRLLSAIDSPMTDAEWRRAVTDPSVLIQVVRNAEALPTRRQRALRALWAVDAVAAEQISIGLMHDVAVPRAVRAGAARQWLQRQDEGRWVAAVRRELATVDAPVAQELWLQAVKRDALKGCALPVATVGAVTPNACRTAR